MPDLPTFSVDDGFSYSVPDALTGLSIGSIVRVPLGGRRVRGYVVDLRDSGSSHRKLRQIGSISGDLPIFDRRHLETLRWASIHYVAPLAALLPRPAPPNLPRRGDGEAAWASAPVADVTEPSRLPLATQAASEGRHVRPQYWLSGKPSVGLLSALVAPVVGGGGSVLFVVSTVVEAAGLAKGLGEVFGDRVGVATSARPAAEVTRLWAGARVTPGSIVVGTREAVFWPVAALAMIVVLDEGRRGMKSKQTPTTHVREIAQRRSGVERVQLVVQGAVPTLEVVSSGYEITQPGRPWPLVEIVDRNEEPPGSGFVSSVARRALSAAVRDGRRAFVLVHRRGYAPAFRCATCRTVRRCDNCGAAADRGAQCRRCGASLGACKNCGATGFEPMGAGVGRIVEELQRGLGDGVGAVEASDAPVLVGTERDLAGLAPVDVAVAVDLDAIILAPHYRSTEDGLRLGARLANAVAPGSGRRAIIQTSMPTHDVIVALRSGRPMEFLGEELERRLAHGFPPAGDLVAVDVRGGPDTIDGELREAAGDFVRGPAPVDEGNRWLIQGGDLRPVKLRLRRLVQGWRDAGARVRIDVDPIDL